METSSMMKSNILTESLVHIAREFKHENNWKWGNDFADVIEEQDDEDDEFDFLNS